MSHKIARPLVWLSAALLTGFFVAGLQTSATSAQEQKAATPEKKAAPTSLSVTGCLQKGMEPSGYFIAAEDGKMWELSTKTVKLDEHVGHKVTLTGYQIHKSKAAEEKMAKTEKPEAAGKDYADLNVTRLKMISESCSN